mmetsp:Transcript_15296/g.22137  ORF Transcript_15296/g.22137 Transcript_15296/m.22137 type:complete len:141 (-) Transcript_15296:401-823(-)
MTRITISFLLALSFLALASGFTVTTTSTTSTTTTKSLHYDTSLNFFGGLSKAFDNEDMGAKQNAGLKNGPKYNEAVTINGKQVKAVVGQQVKQVANSARVKIPYNCQQGDCGTCMIKMNGRKVKACQMSIPGGKCAIETL